MQSLFPIERAAKRTALLKAVDGVRDTLQAGVAAAEAERTLPAASVRALREAGLFALKAPIALGGAEADPVTQIEVIEAISYIDPSAGWASFIGAGALSLCAFLPDAAIERMWAGGRIPTAAGLVMPGRAVRENGGYRVNGRWSWGSGIRHAEWVGVHVIVEDAAGAPAGSRFVMLPASDIEIHDNWYVSGLKGTGSCDFTIADRLVPESFSFDLRKMAPVRGGPLYNLGMPGLIANELGGFAVGVARRALDEIIAQALSKRRGYGKKATVADRPVFQHVLGECDLKLRAARGLMIEVYEKAWATVCGGTRPDAAQQVEMRSVVAYAMHTALEVAQQAFRYGGGSAVHLDNMLQRCVRDLQVASVHLIVNDSIYEQHGKRLLGATDLNPMV
ncbi:MAG: acyl-CoA dehydrogenase family protein [Gammaproteobacteria bacterium]|nr:acyl-CoA dehydrogenase family protein [Gammaproteobacteria bacterium]